MDMNEKKETLWTKVLQWALIALCSSSLGFGASQISVIGDVRNHSSDIAHLREAIMAEATARKEAEMAEMAARKEGDDATARALDRISGRMDKLLDLISLQLRDQKGSKP